MRVIVDVEHPAHVHFFKHFVWEMERRGHEVRISAFDKDVTLRLLDAYGFKYDACGRQRKGLLGSARQLIERDMGVYRLARSFRPDVIVGIGDIAGPHVSRLTGARSIVFSDTEHAKLGNRLSYSAAHVICTPSCYMGDLGRKQVRYNGYHELAYLHPRYFKPDPGVLAGEGLTPNTPFSLVRFVSWGAVHDIGQGGFSREGKTRLVQELSRCGRVLLSSEGELPPELRAFAFKAPPHLIHHFLYYASVCATEGATMASECAVLGTPAIYVNTLSAGTLREQQKRYGLLSCFHDRREEDTAIAAAVEITRASLSGRDEWRRRAARLVKEKGNVTLFMVDTILRAGGGGE
ncbi:MAG: DUF354 domain-containing protein [Dehalococcoidia bacterium]|jgi:hypothetical protein|nr:DUF354 domain-containing protein [Dehalococcoidia bacterium]